MQQVEFPTGEHARAAEAVLAFFRERCSLAVLLVNSCARGVATPESDLDFAVLVDPQLPSPERHALEAAWSEYRAEDEVLRRFASRGPFSSVHLDLFDGAPRPERWDEGGGPDTFEVEIGNRIAHAVPLWEGGRAFDELRSHWLPYYDEALRTERGEMVVEACRLNLERVRAAVGRDLMFYALDRLHHAFQEFLQGLFIRRRVYPIAYNKWIREQVEGWLGLPDLYLRLPSVLEIARLDGPGLDSRAVALQGLVDEWLV
jgi:predicted nucleotidyltransferase